MNWCNAWERFRDCDFQKEHTVRVGLENWPVSLLQTLAESDSFWPDETFTSKLFGNNTKLSPFHTGHIGSSIPNDRVVIFILMSLTSLMRLIGRSALGRHFTFSSTQHLNSKFFYEIQPWNNSQLGLLAWETWVACMQGGSVKLGGGRCSRGLFEYTVYLFI